MVFSLTSEVKKRKRLALSSDPSKNSKENKSIFRWKTVFGIPGGSLYDSELNNANAVEAGIKGERSTARVLEELASLYKNMYVFHSVKLPGHQGDIDHLVIQGSTILLVDTKNWKKNNTYTMIRDAPKDNMRVLRDGENFDGNVIHLNSQLSDWRKQSQLAKKNVKGVLVIANTSSRIDKDSEINGFPITNLRTLGGVFEETFIRKNAPYTDMVTLYWLKRCLFLPPMGTLRFSDDKEELRILLEDKERVAERICNYSNPWIPTLFLIWAGVILFVLQMVNIPIALLNGYALYFLSLRYYRYCKQKGKAGLVRLGMTITIAFVFNLFWTMLIVMRLFS